MMLCYGVGNKPKMLLRKDADSKLVYDIVSTEPYVYGLQAGEAVLLHSALIARARGKQYFVLRPNRQKLTNAGVLFLNAGEIDVPTSALFDASTVIAVLSPTMPDPAQAAKK